MGSLEGQQAPDFRLHGTGDKEYSLADFLGRTIILFFYPDPFYRLAGLAAGG